MIPAETRIAIKADIRAHLLDERKGQWAVVRDAHPGIKEATFWRLVNEVKAEMAQAALSAGAASQAVSDGPGAALTAIAPGTAWRALNAKYSAVDVDREFDSLVADAELLRRHALDADGKIANPVLFERSCKLRERLHAHRRDTWAEMLSGERAEVFYSTIIDVIGEASPELQRLVLKRLAAFNAEWRSDVDADGVPLTNGRSGQPWL